MPGLTHLSFGDFSEIRHIVCGQKQMISQSTAGNGGADTLLLRLQNQSSKQSQDKACQRQPRPSDYAVWQYSLLPWTILESSLPRWPCWQRETNKCHILFRQLLDVPSCKPEALGLWEVGEWEIFRSE